MRRQILSTLSALALTSSLFIGVTGASAGVPIPPPRPAELFTPPNCEWVEARGGAYLDCDFPDECELVPFDNGGGNVGFDIQCDLDPGCYLASAEFLGVTYWYIDCWENECIGGCHPTQPLDIGLKGRS